jgi:stress response protein YsnF
VKAESNDAPTKRNKESDPGYKITPTPPLTYSKYSIQRAEPMIVHAEIPKNRTDIVRPASFVKQNSLSAKTVGFANAVIEKASDTINNIKTDEVTLDLGSDFAQNKISVIKQGFSTEKTTAIEEVVIEKRWVEKKTAVEVPVGYEQVFVNNEELKIGLGETLSQIKSKILEVIPIDEDKQEENNDKWVPLFEGQTETERKFPLYAEDIIISKRKVKVGEVSIRKREITKDEKIRVNLITERITVKNPDGETE